MLTSASTLAPRARLQPHVAPAATALPAALLRHRQQTRSFRFGAWPGNGSRDQHREMRRRCRSARHSHADFSRKRWWGRHADLSDDISARPDWQPKRFFAFSQRWAGSRSGDRHRWDTPFDDIRSYMSQRHAEILRDAGFGTQSNSSATAAAGSSARTSGGVVEGIDFVIDPITNRKIPKASAKPTPRSMVEDDESPISFDGPIAPPTLDSDLPPTPAELRAYKNVVVDDVHSGAGSKSAGGQVPPDLSSISDNSETCYMSWKYKDVFSGRNGSNGVLPNAIEAAEYDDLHRYKPVQYNEPDGAVQETTSVQDPEELHQYKPVAWNEPDGKPTEPPVEMGHEGYDPAEVSQYRPVRWNEPDGKPSEPAVEIGHEGYDPAEVSQYQPVRWNEPHGKSNEPVELGHLGYDPEEVAKYKPFYWNEPDGKPKEPVELGHTGYDPAEVARYKPFNYNEPDGKPTTPPAEIGHEGYDPAEVSQYKPFKYNEPDGKPTTPPVEIGHEGYDPAEVAQYKPFKHNEPDGKPTTSPAEIGHEGYDPAEVQKYNPFKHNEPDGKPPLAEAEPAQSPSDLGSYGAVRYQEPDGQPPAAIDGASESLKEYDLKAEAPETSEEVYAKILRRIQRLSTLESEEAAPEIAASSSSTKSDKQPSQSRETMESSMARMNAEADAVDQLARTSVRASQGRSRRRMSAEERKQALADPYSTEPQGLETAFAEECASTNTWPAYSKIHKAVPRKDSAVDEQTTTVPGTAAKPAAKPVLYKILAYDPATESVSIAETTSTVPDMAAPLAPGEVMLRLSHPTKFIPHLKPLEKQGFEMVSGSGDVLVFRQIGRAANANSGTAAASAVDGTSAASPTSSVDPHVTSPLQGTAARKGQAVRREETVFSGSKERAAERVDATAKSGRKAAGLGKRVVVGATWVAGVSYALGVVSEYAKGH